MTSFGRLQIRLSHQSRHTPSSLLSHPIIISRTLRFHLPSNNVRYSSKMHKRISSLPPAKAQSAIKPKPKPKPTPPPTYKPTNTTPTKKPQPTPPPTQTTAPTTSAKKPQPQANPYSAYKPTYTTLPKRGDTKTPPKTLPRQPTPPTRVPLTPSSSGPVPIPTRTYTPLQVIFNNLRRNNQEEFAAFLHILHTKILHIPPFGPGNPGYEEFKQALIRKNQVRQQVLKTDADEIWKARWEAVKNDERRLILEWKWILFKRYFGKPLGFLLVVFVGGGCWWWWWNRGVGNGGDEAFRNSRKEMDVGESPPTTSTSE